MRNQVQLITYIGRLAGDLKQLKELPERLDRSDYESTETQAVGRKRDSRRFMMSTT